MSSTKRKAVTDDRPQKRVKSAKPEAESKSTKSSAKPAKENRPPKPESSERRGPVKSVLQQEERSFPRGGASVLTPIETKQIQAQAEKDVLFEQQTGEKPVRDEDDDLFDDAAEAPVKQKRKARKEDDGEKKVAATRIQGLSYKTLVPGSIVLGRVTGVTGKDVAIALANNLTGYAPITAVSERLNKRISDLLAEDVEEDEDDDDSDVDLKKLFFEGQWLRAKVTSTGHDSTDQKAKRHIELSVDPVQVNGGLEADSVVTHSMLQASVRSVEDHGVIMDLGLATDGVRGFISKKELGAAYKLEELEEGQVMMCLVTGKGSDGKVLKLSPDAARFSAHIGNKQAPVVTEAPIVDAYLPGTAVEVLVTECSHGGVVGKLMGMLNVTADLVHSGVGEDEDLSAKYKISSKIKARIIWSLPGDDGARKLGVSLLEILTTLPPPPDKLPENANPKLKALATSASQKFPNSATIEDAKVTQVIQDRGIHLALPSLTGQSGATAFAHISQVSDARVESLASTTGAFKVGSSHKVRVLSFNPIDGLYYVSLKQSILDQAYMRLEDVAVGEVVQGKVDRLLLGGSKGITGVLVKLSDSITGLVPEMHLSDARLEHPERKFRDGFPITVRVLSIDLDRRQIRLTAKKSLVSDTESAIWSNYEALQPEMESKGTIVNLLDKGAVVQFFGNVRAWLPVSEMSEAYVERPDRHFRIGQTVTARIVSVSPETKEMKVSCKTGGDIDDEQHDAWEGVQGGQIVPATVTEKTLDSVLVDLENGIKGVVRAAHLLDGSAAKAESALKRIRVGQKLTDLLVLNKFTRSRQVMLTNKPDLIEDAKKGALIRSFTDVKKGNKVHGFVRSVTPEGVYVEFANGTVGLVLKTQLAPEMLGQAAFGLRKDQSVTPWVLNVDAAKERFLLSLREQKLETPAVAATASPSIADAPELANPVDPALKTTADLSLHTVTKARVASVKGTQINVRLADNAHGRIDVSEAFDSWDDFKNKKAPLQQFQPNDVLDVKILGIHDSRNHRFLPITHRQNKNPVYELSAKKSRVEDGDNSLLGGLEGVSAGESHLAFVNNHGDDCVWVNLSPSVRGRIALMDLSDDVGMLNDLSKHFGIGSALKVKVKNVMSLSNRLDLTARLGDDAESVTFDTMTPGSVVAGRVTKVSENSVTVQLGDSIAGPVTLTELSDDFDQADPARYAKNEIVRVCVLDIDRPNKRVYLSLRASKVLSSTLPVKDPQFANISALKAGDIVRGFVKHISEKGIIASLSATVDAFIRVADLSDLYIKNWQSHLTLDQLVRGRIISVDPASKHIQLSLKQSQIDPNYVAPLQFNDIKTGMIVTGKVRKVEDYGAFVDLDNSQPRLSGLCHRSEVADKFVKDVRTLYEVGDVVKAKVLKVEKEGKKISLGLKARYFKDDGAESDDEEVKTNGHASDDDEEMEDATTGGVELAAEIIGADNDEDMEDVVDLGAVRDMDDSEDDGVAVPADDDSEDEAVAKPTAGLSTTGFDWSGNTLSTTTEVDASDSEPDTTTPKKRKRTKPEIKVDLTADLDAHGPRSTSDFERQLLGQPNDSALWIQYMAFQLQLGEVQKARDLAERALRTIHIRESDEKGNIWIALLNLEVEYGDEEKVDEVFKRACQVQEPLSMHEKLASIYIDSGKHDKADKIFERAVGNKSFRAVPEMWLNYATFLMSTHGKPDEARALLPRALQSIAKDEHRLLTAKFAGLEFRSAGGDAERGRTIFETLVGEWPKWTQGWDMWVDLERACIAEDKPEAVERCRKLFERMSAVKMKKRRAKFVFKRWLEFEEKEGAERDVERVKGVAKKWVEDEAARQGGTDE
ncbi:rRNA biogenesis protein rrp5 [Oleoguttula sp. CCFEE 5521]